MNTAETVERVVAPVLSTLGIELVDVESHPGHLRVTIDRSSGLDLAAISQATTAVSHALDEADAVPGGRYELEVSSPGLERRLRRPEHFARFVGTEIAVRLRPGVAEDGERRVEGQLVAADEAGIELELASPGGNGGSATATSSAPTRSSTGGPPLRAPRRPSAPTAARRARRPPSGAGRPPPPAQPALLTRRPSRRHRRLRQTICGARAPPATTEPDAKQRRLTTTDT